MLELNDSDLLRKYADGHSEEAFATLVARHINKVYSTALRHTRNPSQAEEITQAVFVILAKKARSLNKGVVISGWLYQTARLASITFLKGEIRRARREQEAHMQNLLNETANDETWMQIAPLLDAAMAGLSETDRHAVVLRYFDGKSLREVGAALGATEDAAKKRLGRALEKLQRFFAKRGVSSTTAIIADAISSNSVQAAPPALADVVTAAAIAKGVAASTSTLTLVKGVIKAMAWSKAQTIVVTSVAILLAAGTATVVEEIYQSYGPIYQGKPLSVWLKQYDLPKLPNGSLDWKTFGPRWRETNKIVQEAGTNALPTLLRLLQEENINTKKHNAINGEEADMGFAALGAKAKDSTPSLIEIYQRNPAARGDVLYSLNCIGTNADVPIDWLLPKLKDPDPQIRAGIAYVLGQMHTKSDQAIPALILCLSDSSSHVRADAALALGSCGADAKPAIPQLITLLNDKGKGVRNCAIFAIKQIDPETAANAGLK